MQNESVKESGHTPDCTFEAMRFLYMLGHRMTMEAGL